MQEMKPLLPKSKIVLKKDNELLFEAIENHTYDDVCWLIKAKADLNKPNAVGFTPLQWAIVKGAPFSITKALVFAGADVKAQDMETDGDTALHLACERGDLETAEFLVAAKANINATNRQGETIVHAAVLAQRPITLTWVLNQKGINTEARRHPEQGEYIGHTAKELCEERPKWANISAASAQSCLAVIDAHIHNTQRTR